MDNFGKEKIKDLLRGFNEQKRKVDEKLFSPKDSAEEKYAMRQSQLLAGIIDRLLKLRASMAKQNEDI